MSCGGGGFFCLLGNYDKTCKKVPRFIAGGRGKEGKGNWSYSSLSRPEAEGTDREKEINEKQYFEVKRTHAFGVC